MNDDPDGMSPTDWYKDKVGNYIYDASLTAQNAASLLQEGEVYLGTSATINLVNPDGASNGTISLNENGTVSGAGAWYEAGNFTWNHSGNTVATSAIEVDPGLKNGAKIYGVDEGKVNDKSLSFSGSAKDYYELSKSTGEGTTIKLLDIGIREKSVGIANAHNKFQTLEAQEKLDKYSPDRVDRLGGAKGAEAGFARVKGTYERDSVNLVKQRKALIEKRNQIIKQRNTNL